MENTKKYYTFELVRLVRKFRNILILASILFAFFSAAAFEQNDNWRLMIPAFIVLVIVTVLSIFIENNFNYSKIPDYCGTGKIEIINVSQSFNKSWKSPDSEDLGPIGGIWRGYSFEYRKGNKVSYTGIKLFYGNIEESGFKEFLDQVYDAYGYYPTGRVVFRGYWREYPDNNFRKINYSDLTLDFNNHAVFKGDRVVILNKKCDTFIDEGYVTGIDQKCFRVYYLSSDGCPNKKDVFSDYVVVKECK